MTRVSWWRRVEGERTHDYALFLSNSNTDPLNVSLPVNIRESEVSSKQLGRLSVFQAECKALSSAPSTSSMYVDMSVSDSCGQKLGPSYRDSMSYTCDIL